MTMPRLEAAAEAYRRHGWPVAIRNRSIVLPMAAPFGGVVLPMTESADVLRHLAATGCRVPTLVIPAARPMCVFLVDNDGTALGRQHHLPDVRVLWPTDVVPLPPSELDNGETVRWIVRPAPRNCLPTLTAVISAVTYVLIDNARKEKQCAR